MLFTRHHSPDSMMYEYGRVCNTNGIANKLRCLVSALRSCHHVHCDDDQINSLHAKPLPHTAPNYHYQMFVLGLISPFWNP